MSETLETVGATNVQVEAKPWKKANPPEELGYCFDAVLVKDEAGDYVATVAQLPGVISEGNDFRSAIDTLVEAFRATIETYKAEGMPIPWREPPPKQTGDTYLRVAVHV